jgi:DNA-directed RNA polymerase II subunit RPB7
MEDIYFNCTLLKRVVIPSKHLNTNIDIYINDYIKRSVEGLCVDEGYIKPDTVSILKKSVGSLLGSNFTGDITYDIAYTAQICNPVIGNIIECKVKFVNKMGILASNGPITVIIGRQFHLNNELDKISRDDIIKVEVVAKTFSLKDKEIKVVAKLYGVETVNSIKKSNLNDFTESDLTPIEDDEFDDGLIGNTEDITENITDDILDESDEELFSMNDGIEQIEDESDIEYDEGDDEEDEDEIEYDDEKEKINLKELDPENINIGDIELSDEEDDDYAEDIDE